MQSALLDGLTEPQREAVSYVDGPLLVLAGPGSGKTRVITRRVAYLVREVGIAPWQVLAITFTNKAAGEMQARVAELVSQRQARALTLCTFHSLCARLLRQHAQLLGFPPGFSIYDSDDQKRAVKQALEDLEISASNFSPANVLSSISKAKNELVDADAYRQSADNFYSKTVAKVYAKYTDILHRNAAMDFDDLLLYLVQLFRGHPQTLRELQDRYQYVLIDEYQDTNHAQFLIAAALAQRHQNLCATGDPDQSIYGWRGANIRNILEFEQQFPGAKVVRLEQNYRSTGHILAAADALIRHNTARKHKELFTEAGDGARVRCVTCFDERDEAESAVEFMQKVHDEQNIAWSGMAVFYRMNSLSRVMEDALRNAGIPYQIARGTAFYERAEIRNVVAYLRAIVNPADEVALLRIINMPTRGIGDRSIEAVQAFAIANHMTFDQVITDPRRVTSLSTRAQNTIAAFAAMLRKWRQTAGFEGDTPQLPQDQPGLRLFVEDVIRQSGLHDAYLNDKSDPDQERLANLGEFVTFTQQFEDDLEFNREDDDADQPLPLRDKLLAMLEQISLVSDVDNVNSDSGAVTLMTLHAAKGLEFPVVTILGLEDGLLPHQRAGESARPGDALEEERRLCFVGITRAMRYLTLSHAIQRTIFGRTMSAIASPFLRELPEEHLEQISHSADDDEDDHVLGESLLQRRQARGLASEYPIGCYVRHNEFGLGVVESISAEGAHTRCRVRFLQVGRKTLILQYARLERVDPDDEF